MGLPIENTQIDDQKNCDHGRKHPKQDRFDLTVVPKKREKDYAHEAD